MKHETKDNPNNPTINSEVCQSPNKVTSLNQCELCHTSLEGKFLICNICHVKHCRDCAIKELPSQSQKNLISSLYVCQKCIFSNNSSLLNNKRKRSVEDNSKVLEENENSHNKKEDKDELILNAYIEKIEKNKIKNNNTLSKCSSCKEIKNDLFKFTTFYDILFYAMKYYKDKSLSIENNTEEEEIKTFKRELHFFNYFCSLINTSSQSDNFTFNPDIIICNECLEKELNKGSSFFFNMRANKTFNPTYTNENKIKDIKGEISMSNDTSTQKKNMYILYEYIKQYNVEMLKNQINIEYGLRKLIDAFKRKNEKDINENYSSLLNLNSKSYTMITSLNENVDIWKKNCDITFEEGTETTPMNQNSPIDNDIFSKMYNQYPSNIINNNRQDPMMQHLFMLNPIMFNQILQNQILQMNPMPSMNTNPLFGSIDPRPMQYYPSNPTVMKAISNVMNIADFNPIVSLNPSLGMNIVNYQNSNMNPFQQK